MKKGMTVQELIDRLEKIENKEKEIRIVVHQYNKAQPVAHLKPWKQDHLAQYTDYWVDIQVSLPRDENSFMYTGTRKLPYGY